MKTAVEWFYQRILAEDIKTVFEQAKEMEKEQIMNCCIQTTQDCYVAIMEHLNAPLQFTDEDLSDQKLEAEQYYNQTFNK
jgi:hypothetical protein